MRRTPTLAALAFAAFAALVADTVLRGPFSAGIQGVSDAVTGWRDAGVPVHAIGYSLSLLGDFLVLVPVLLVALGLALAAKDWRLAVALALAAGLGPACVATLQPVLTPLNRPLDGLTPELVPDVESPPRGPGEHLFPSGHATEAALDWGLLAFAALPRFLSARGVGEEGRRRWAIAAAIGWAAVSLLAGAGRVLRQAHGYNDVAAGWALGAALLCAALMAIDAARRPRRAG